MSRGQLPSWAARIALLGVAALAACSTTDAVTPVSESSALPEETRDVPAPVLSEVVGSTPSLAVCGNQIGLQLRAGRNTPGTVTVSNDAQNLYVTYDIATTQKDWFISNTRLAVVTYADAIRNSSKWLDPWSYPYGGDHSPGIKTRTYTLPLASNGWKTGDRLIVASMAGVVHPTTTDYNGRWEWLTAWGLPGVSGNTITDLPIYTVKSCGSTPTPPPPTPAKAAITITFDDGFASMYANAYPIMKEFGLKGNVAVNALPIQEEWRGYMTLANLKELDGQGWAMISHTMTHPFLTTVTDSALKWELVENRKWLERNGFRGAYILAIPYHQWGERERAAAKLYYSATRGYFADQFSPPKYARMPITEPYDLTAYEPEWGPWSTPEGRQKLRDHLDRAVAQGAHVDIFFHKFPPESVPHFREVVRILAEYKQYIRTYDEVIPAPK